MIITKQDVLNILKIGLFSFNEIMGSLLYERYRKHGMEEWVIDAIIEDVYGTHSEESLSSQLSKILWSLWEENKVEMADNRGWMLKKTKENK